MDATQEGAKAAVLSFADIDLIAFHCGYPPWCSNTIRTARFRTSSGYRSGATIPL